MQSPSLSEIPPDPISKSEDSNPQSPPSIITAPDVSNEADLSVSIAEPEVENSSELEQSDDSPKINPPFSTTTEDTGKVAWRDFLSNFKNRSTHIPFPELIKGDEVTVDEADMMLHDSGIDAELKNLENPEFCRNIAKQFLEKFPPPESDWKDASLLLRADPDTAYWVAGDIHAKTDALAKICAFIYRNKTKDRNVLILLGDFIDRGDKPVETLAFIEAIKNASLFPGFEVITLKGNHDVGLSRNELGDYVSMVSPAETADFFQRSKANGENLTIEADAAMRLAAVSPRMCELTGIDPNDPARTMLFVHGGVPHVDLQEKLYAARNEIPQKEPFLSALDRESIPESLRRGCAEDFTWIRFAKDLPLKKPNRGSRGCEIGTEDVAQYIFLHRILTTRDISFIFRGHDHERDGFACYSAHQDMNPSKKPFVQRDCHVLTLNAMEPDLSSNGIFRERDIALAQWSVGEPVRLHKILTRHIHFNKNDDTPPDVADVPRVDTKEAE